MVDYIERVQLDFFTLSGLDNLSGHLDNVILIAFLEAEEHLLADELIVLAFLEIGLQSDLEMVKWVLEIKSSHLDGFDDVFISCGDLAASNVLI